MPIRFIYADVCSPGWLRPRLKALADAWNFEIVQFEDPLWPTDVRRQLAPGFDTQYVVFVDNDVVVAPGWLEEMCACAEETGAGIVGPLYLWGADGNSDRIHMAGGELKEEYEPGGLVLRERHLCIDEPVGKVSLSRSECGFVEYHCMLMRDAVYRAPGIFDPNIKCAHEHIHASLVARDLGYKTISEPAARVTYLATSPYCFADLPLYRRRWAYEAGESSIRAFAKRWGVIDDRRSFAVRDFLVKHRREVDPVREELYDSAIAHAPMQASGLKQTLTELIEAAAARGYDASALRMIGRAHWAALLLSNGGYRPCGRPFLNHLTGSASVLVHYGIEVRLICGALLHAAYSHAPRLAADPGATLGIVAKALGGEGTALEKLVRAYTLRVSRWRMLEALPNWQHVATTLDVETAVIGIANDIDMHLSGEVRATGRTDLDAVSATHSAEICGTLGVPGLAQTLLQQDRPSGAVSIPSSAPRISFRLEKGRPVSMVNNASIALLAAKAETPVALQV